MLSSYRNNKKKAGTSPTKDWILLSPQFQPEPEPSSMIMIMDKGCNPVCEEIYKKIIAGLGLHQLTCTCKRTGTFTKYGTYSRKLRYRDEAQEISIQRVVCSECGRTHALLPSSIVPYAQIPLREQVIIIEHYEDQADMEQFLQEDSKGILKLLLQHILSVMETVPLVLPHTFHYEHYIALKTYLHPIHAQHPLGRYCGLGRAG